MLQEQLGDYQCKFGRTKLKYKDYKPKMYENKI